MNFWDRFQLVPVGSQFWHAGLSFDVFAVNHHGYRAAYGLALPGTDIPPARGERHRHRCLAALAGFRP